MCTMIDQFSKPYYTVQITISKVVFVTIHLQKQQWTLMFRIWCTSTTIINPYSAWIKIIDALLVFI